MIFFSELTKLINSDNVALLSIAITFLIFVITKYQETRYKKIEDKKIQYLKLIELMQKIFMSPPLKENKKGEVILPDEMRKLFFDAGSSLLLYGSKRIYRRYIFFREFTINPLVKQCKYYKEDFAMYIMSDILRTMRREVGLSLFNNVDDNDALAFFLNDISSNPIADERRLEACFRLKMIRFELWMIERHQLIWLKTLLYGLVKPIFGTVIIVLKYLVVIPFGRLMACLLPQFVQNKDSVKSNESN